MLKAVQQSFPSATQILYQHHLEENVRRHLQKISSNWIPLNWNNTNCGSLNNILKLSTNWNALKLPDLIEKMYSILKLQYADVRQALHWHGNYQVIPPLKSFVLSNTAWSQKTEEEKVKRHFRHWEIKMFWHRLMVLCTFQRHLWLPENLINVNVCAIPKHNTTEKEQKLKNHDTNNERLVYDYYT